MNQKNKPTDTNLQTRFYLPEFFWGFSSLFSEFFVSENFHFLVKILYISTKCFHFLANFFILIEVSLF